MDHNQESLELNRPSEDPRVGELRHELAATQERLQAYVDKLALAHEQLREKERKLIACEGNLQALMDSSLQGVVLLDDAHQVIRVNAKAHDLFSAYHDQPLKPHHSILEYFPEAEAIRVSQALEAVWSGQQSHVAWELTPDEGPLAKPGLECRISSAKSATGEILGLALCLTDISQQQQEEAYLRMLESVVVHAHDAVLITEAASAANHGPTIVYVNEAFTRMTGYSREEVLGKNPRFLQGAGTSQEELDRVRHVLQNGETGEIELLNYRKDQTPYWVGFSLYPVTDKSDNVTHWVSIQRDITKLRGAQQRLEDLNERFSLAVQSAKLGIWEFDVKNDRLIWDEGMFDLYGIAPENFHGRYDDWKSTVHPDDFLATEQAVFHALHTGERFESIFRILLPDGSIRFIVASAIVHHDQHGESLGMVGVNFDITEERLAQEEISQAKNLAEEMARLKTTFLSNMSHEIRTPLNGILGLLPMLRIVDDPKMMADILHMMEESGQRLLDTLTGILELAQIEAEQTDYSLVELELGDLVEEIYLGLKSVAHAKGLQYLYHRPDEAFHILGDRRMVALVFTNMIGNALKFTEVGKVEIHIGTTTIQHTSYVAVKIRDTGIGIAPENLDKIFKSFKQESEGFQRNYEGSGLGLAIVRRYTEMLEGIVDVQSEKGKGSTFTIYLPIYHPS